MYIWLDDVRSAPDGWTHIQTIEAVIDILKTGVVTAISFDHDLGYEKTGYDLAKWIEVAAFNDTLPRLEWAVHSANPVGRTNIQTAMNNANRYWESHEKNNS